MRILHKNLLLIIGLCLVNNLYASEEKLLLKTKSKEVVNKVITKNIQSKNTSEMAVVDSETFHDTDGNTLKQQTEIILNADSDHVQTDEENLTEAATGGKSLLQRYVEDAMKKKYSEMSEEDKKYGEEYLCSACYTGYEKWTIVYHSNTKKECLECLKKNLTKDSLKAMKIIVPEAMRTSEDDPKEFIIDNLHIPIELYDLDLIIYIAGFSTHLAMTVRSLIHLQAEKFDEAGEHLRMHNLELCTNILMIGSECTIIATSLIMLIKKIAAKGIKECHWRPSFKGVLIGTLPVIFGVLKWGFDAYTTIDYLQIFYFGLGQVTIWTRGIAFSYFSKEFITFYTNFGHMELMKWWNSGLEEEEKDVKMQEVYKQSWVKDDGFRKDWSKPLRFVFIGFSVVNTFATWSLLEYLDNPAALGVHEGRQYQIISQTVTFWTLEFIYLLFKMVTGKLGSVFTLEIVSIFAMLGTFLYQQSVSPEMKNTMTTWSAYSLFFVTLVYLWKQESDYKDLGMENQKLKRKLIEAKDIYSKKMD